MERGAFLERGDGERRRRRRSGPRGGGESAPVRGRRRRATRLAELQSLGQLCAAAVRRAGGRGGRAAAGAAGVARRGLHAAGEPVLLRAARAVLQHAAHAAHGGVQAARRARRRRRGRCADAGGRGGRRRHGVGVGAGWQASLWGPGRGQRRPMARRAARIAAIMPAGRRPLSRAAEGRSEHPPAGPAHALPTHTCFWSRLLSRWSLAIRLSWAGSHPQRGPPRCGRHADSGIDGN
jgi:hypothetical protein